MSLFPIPYCKIHPIVKSVYRANRYPALHVRQCSKYSRNAWSHPFYLFTLPLLAKLIESILEPARFEIYPLVVFLFWLSRSSVSEYFSENAFFFISSSPIPLNTTVLFFARFLALLERINALVRADRVGVPVTVIPVFQNARCARLMEVPVIRV